MPPHLLVSKALVVSGSKYPTLRIGHVGRQPLLDVIFTNSASPTAGPFPSVSDFHDWFTTTYGPNKYLPNWRDKPPHPYRSRFLDSIPIVLTHADLHPSNIILSPGPSPRVIAVIDWHQSGWYPAYWEYCKARWTSKIGEEWESKYLPLFLDPCDYFKPERCEFHDIEGLGFYDYWDYFNLARGV